MTKAGQPAQATPGMWNVVFDYSAGAPAPGAALLLVCKGCGARFLSDYEERWCGDCVERAEVLGLPMLTP